MAYETRVPSNQQKQDIRMLLDYISRALQQQIEPLIMLECSRVQHNLILLELRYGSRIVSRKHLMGLGGILNHENFACHAQLDDVIFQEGTDRDNGVR